jgi:2-amino-4-hydroxy-6-hydroxymethyldihydropteridine diphosphokinase
MEFDEWEPYYREIIEYFGIPQEEDERAARVLASLLPRDDCQLLSALCKGRTVTVCGNAPCLPRELGRMVGSIFAADAASEVLRRYGIRPDAVFTDLDGATDDYLAMNREGTVMVIHAHGDNIPLLLHWVPLFSGPVVGTTQARPCPPLHNFGGFSDGDRAAFAADALMAEQIRFIGFDLDDQDVDPMKRGKLQWARKLLRLIGYDC